MDKKERKRLARRRFLKLLGLTLGVGIAIPAEARYVEPNWIEVTRHTVYLPHLPKELEGMTVALLTDIHHGPITPEKTIKDAIRLTAAAKPDLVALTGDFVHSDPVDAELLAPLLAPLQSARFGLYGCLGNHDYGGDDRNSGEEVADALEQGANVRMLRNAHEQVAPGLYIAGIEDTMRGFPNPRKALDGIPESAAGIFLTHNPTGVFASDNLPYLVLSGHTHGGQIRIPGMAPHAPPGMPGFPLIEGWGLFDKSRLYISRGVGMGGFPMRFRCRPEVAIFTLVRGDGMPETRPNLAGRAVGKVARFAKNTAHRFM